MLKAGINQSRRIGVEIEVALPVTSMAAHQQDVQETLAQILCANGLRSTARGYSHAPVPNNIDLCVERDSSIRGESRYEGITWYQIEVKTRILNGLGDFDLIVPKFCQIARYVNAKPTQSCGVHIHLDVSQEVRENVRFVSRMLNLFWRFEPLILGLVAPSRRGSGYCSRIPDMRDAWSRCRSMSCYRERLGRWMRHCGLNITHIWETAPRIEVRWHGASLDAAKIRHWIVLMNRLLDHAATRNIQKPRRQEENTRKGLERMFVSVGLKPNSRVYRTIDKELRETARYLLKRWKHFNGNVALRRGGNKDKKEGR